ncbi:hypothetical protein RNF85_000402 [Salmonella enterica]|nr:hypothetical protein [Salmonella enterica]
MSIRSEIIDGHLAQSQSYGLIYTEVLGWIDLGHAQGTDIRNLWAQMLRGESPNEPTYDVTYKQSMLGLRRRLTVGKSITWRIKKGLPYHQKQSIALAMMMTVARRFESLQGSFPFSLATDSGFSCEDLVSDLLGFYRVMSCMNNVFDYLKPVSKQEALKRWDYYGKVGSWKNETFKPLLFPDPVLYPNRRPYFGQLPNFMKTVIPYNNWKSGNVIIMDNRGFIRFGVEEPGT